ncbi:hypothetical protein MY3296_008606 [Beauveria thailandica]
MPHSPSFTPPSGQVGGANMFQASHQASQPKDSTAPISLPKLTTK